MSNSLKPHSYQELCLILVSMSPNVPVVEPEEPGFAVYAPSERSIDEKPQAALEKLLFELSLFELSLFELMPFTIADVNRLIREFCCSSSFLQFTAMLISKLTNRIRIMLSPYLLDSMPIERAT
ncbi:hypothetical protein LEP1GSC068_2309 [Leptospira sp. Fiocruz LV3954]|nr:hypothetical protein LEP1GSC068_2309 [Leptospira sp. Fiocruz LV3954]EMI60983.1 hypothetical protein LEP1GSC076_0007 [Leptospira sp. Fiocruz LV4135]